MCKDYKEFDIDYNDVKCLKIDCPHLKHCLKDYGYETVNGDTEWIDYDLYFCELKHSNDEKSKCPLFGFTKTDNFKVNYI